MIPLQDDRILLATMKGNDFRIQQISLARLATELIYEKNFEDNEFESLVSINVPENMVYSNEFDIGLDIHYFYHGCSTVEIVNFSLNDSRSRSRAFKAPLYSQTFLERFKLWMESNEAINYFSNEFWSWDQRRRNKKDAAEKL
jgi:hypothetical protein